MDEVRRGVPLGSTALIGAGMFLASPAHAQLEVTLSGFTEFGIVWADEDALVQPAGDPSDNNFDFFMDNEVFIQVEGVDDATGITYGTQVELEVGSFDVEDEEGGQGQTVTDEVLLFFSGVFGRVELGWQDGAAEAMLLGGESVAAGTGGIDGDLPINLTGGNIFAAGWGAGGEPKATYFTPRLAGFQVGISYSPIVGDFEGDFDNVVEAGVNFVQEFGGFNVGVAGVATLTRGFADLDEDASWAVGGTIGFAGFNIGASYARDEGNPWLQAEFITAGVGFGLGPVNVSFTYERDDFDDAPADGANLLVASTHIELMPGVVLKADLGYNSDSLTDDAAKNAWAAVATVQLNY